MNIKIIFFNTIFTVDHLEIFASTSRHQHRHWRRHFKYFIFALRVFCFFFKNEIKGSRFFLVLICSASLASLPESFPKSWSSYSVENLLVPASVKRNSTADVISEIVRNFKIGKAEICSS